MFHGERYIELSRALMSEHFEAKTFHTTFVVRKGRIQKIGINSPKTHPRNLKHKYIGKEGKDIRAMIGVHSEMNAIIKYGHDDCSDCVFVNVRINRNGELAIAAPCRGCQHVLKQVGYRRLYYTTDTGIFKEWC